MQEETERKPARRKPARASMDREPNSHTTLAWLGIEPGPHWWKAREQPLRQPARPICVCVIQLFSMQNIHSEQTETKLPINCEVFANINNNLGK